VQVRAQRRRRPLAALVAVGLLVLSAGAASGAPPDDLDTARGQLEAASRDLDEVAAAIREVGDAVAAADERLRAASTSLSQVRAQLAEATAAAASAAEIERGAAAELAEASTLLADLGDRHRDGRDLLAEQAVAAYKHGGDVTTGRLISGMVRAGDLHEVAVAREVIGRVLTDQRDAVDADIALTRATAEASTTVGDTRRRAVDAARAAAAERRRVEDLVAEQEQLIAAVEREAAARRETLARLEADATARAVLVRDLEARVAAMEVAAVSVRVPVRVDLALDGPPPSWAVGLPAAGRPWAATIDAVAASEGIDGRLLAALVWTESNFRPDAVSHAGAYGMAQLMPGTARGLGVDPRDPVANLTGGARYLGYQLDAFGRVDLALAAYNAGPGRVRAAGHAVPNIVETQLYVVRVLDRYEKLSAL
jgi:soluble lytic murein transglycosylase-like protein